MVVFPCAKINIGLNVIERRSDGFHNIESVFYPIPFCDILEVVENRNPKDKVVFFSSGITIPGDVSDNLCVRAYNLLAVDFSLPSVKIHLHKIIPIGAGLGGGSSDAAFFIRLMNDKFSLGLSSESMKKYAAQLGSDCSFFIDNVPAFASGRGELLESINLSLKGYWLVLVCSSVHVSTVEAYGGVIPQKPLKLLTEIFKNNNIEEWRHLVANDFEQSVFKKHPALNAIKQKLYENGAVYASMTGSGSAVYGLFKQKTNLEKEFLPHFLFQREL